MTNCKCGKAIEQHEAGRCLDAWISELVGWKVKWMEDGSLQRNLHPYVWSPPKGMTTQTEYWIEAPRYSTDLNHAIKFVKFVCEKLDELRGTHSVSYVSHRLQTYTNFQVSIFRFDWRIVGQEIKSQQDEAAHAICIAGLKTLHLIEKMKEER